MAAARDVGGAGTADCDTGRSRAPAALLINPFYPKDPQASFGKHVLTPSLTLTSVAAATPANWDVRYWDENVLHGAPPCDPVPRGCRDHRPSHLSPAGLRPRRLVAVSRGQGRARRAPRAFVSRRGRGACVAAWASGPSAGPSRSRITSRRRAASGCAGSRPRSRAFRCSYAGRAPLSPTALPRDANSGRAPRRPTRPTAALCRDRR